MDREQLQRFLAKIAQIESGGGKHIQHKMMNRGLHKGTSAIGTYGLMPATVQDIIANQEQSGKITPEVQALKQLQYPQLKRQLEQNPDLQNQLASSLAERVLSNQGGNEEKAAYSWNMGHNLPPERITPQKLQTHPYVEKYRSLKNLVPVKEVAQSPSSFNWDDFETTNE